MAVIKVPKTPKKAFNQHRRPSALRLGQIEHLEWAALPASQRKPHQLPKAKVKTEGQAAERIAQLTKVILASEAARAAEPVPAETTSLPTVTLPPLPRVSPPARPSRQGRKRSSSAARGR